MSDRAPSTASLAFADSLWQRYKDDPSSVSLEWREYFAQIERDEHFMEGGTPKSTLGHKQLLQGHGPGGKECAGCGRAAAMSLLQYNVSQLIRNYRVRGHRMARVNPLGEDLPELAELDPGYYGIPESDMDLIFSAGGLSPEGPITLREIIERLKGTYCGSIGVQYMHIDGTAERDWLQSRMESSRNRIELDRERQLRILSRLSDAVNFEQFLQKKFIGAKSFSLEGAETLIPLLDTAIEKAGSQGIEKIVMGMPHRGRLNVLSNIMGKRASLIFGEFRDSDAEKSLGRGDVKYHLGHHRKWKTVAGKQLDLDLVFNPSHLEFVAPVAQGFTRAWMDTHGDDKGERALMIIMHGDAAIAGEGIVQETFNLSEIDGFSVGGALHIVVNNQIGFTTLSSEGRSTIYASDVAKMLQVPIFHVNGEDPEAVTQALNLALEFRSEFGRDVVIDMYCYRRRGHNESDEPTFTQPLMYKKISRRPNVFESYTDRLLQIGEITREEAGSIHAGRLERLQREFDAVDNAVVPVGKGRPSQGRRAEGSVASVEEPGTGVEAGKLLSLMKGLVEAPEGFNVHRKIRKLLDGRLQMARGEKPVDWGAAEALALASLVDEGTGVRLCGQDSQRGTFSHRHAVLHDVENGSNYLPLAYVGPKQGRITIINSPLSEGAVLGFEYGYSVASTGCLVAWEAQFGDFANVAQVYIDQFIASGEQKWALPSSLVMLLPHGLEGTGPEHASARLERFLASAAVDNYRVASPTTPAQFFHLMRRQALHKQVKPLIVMTPKSMLRNREVVSSLEELASGKFRRILPDERQDPKATERVLLCNGKIYYELLAARREGALGDVAILRIEQLYPLSWQELSTELSQYDDGTPVVWVQEEPLNMGAGGYLQLHYAHRIARRWPFFRIGRPESSSPATGSAASHRLEQSRIIEAALGELEQGEL